MKRSFIKNTASFFGFLFIVFIPFPFSITRAQLPVTDFIFGKLIGMVSSSIFGKTLRDTKVYSDTFSMYILVLLLFIVAIIISLLLLRVRKWALYKEKVFSFFYCLFFYYLALQLMKYGIDKIFKNQFYIPEPNTLYTPLGRLDKDLLYWSSMGTSYFYSVFLGSLEVIAAIFILIKRTRLIGLLMSLGIMLNVVAVNFGFDISVKLYSLFLLYLAVYLVMPYCDRLYKLLLLNKNDFYKPVAVKDTLVKNVFLFSFLKWLAAGIILVEVFYPFIKTKNFNDDMADRPYLHGAYEVKQMITGTDTLTAADSPIKRFFIHRNGYMIFQSADDAMQDYKLEYAAKDSVLVLTDYKMVTTFLPFNYQVADSILTLHNSYNGKPSILTGKAIDWKKLPALRKSFHWTVD